MTLCRHRGSSMGLSQYTHTEPERETSAAWLLRARRPCCLYCPAFFANLIWLFFHSLEPAMSLGIPLARLGAFPSPAALDLFEAPVTCGNVAGGTCVPGRVRRARRFSTSQDCFGCSPPPDPIACRADREDMIRRSQTLTSPDKNTHHVGAIDLNPLVPACLRSRPAL